MENYKVSYFLFFYAREDVFSYFLGLMINDCDDNDNGNYTITVDNNKSSTAEVIVEPKEDKVRSPEPPVETEPVEADAFSKLLPNRLDIDEDLDFLLRCEVNDPNQITTWYLDDDLIEEDNPRFQIINDGKIRQLKGLISVTLGYEYKDG